ncbi:MAG: 4-(cytidine 5'-diphospho)-2-C-methyl-D-erythritol kinase [Chitinophagaceae bacterium]|nr:4-(cytidine 5'-diphospho)-2-C-methyl-D-erythritol kinase [Chitinophagaceae bacterium]
MVVFPNCKINIGLNILGKRPDGYHNLETVFIPIPLKETLEIIRSTKNTTDVIFSHSGIAVDGNINDNLCVKAYHLLKKDFPQLPSIQMHLHKAIPMGAGLGGGSADGAFALQLLNDKFKLNLSANQLIDYALQLGSDCPFFIINHPCFAAGRGEQLEPVSISLAGYQLMLINPGIHVNTGWAFAQLSNQPVANRQLKNLKQHIQEPLQNWRNTIVNDFEGVVFKAHPQLQQIKDELYHNQAVYAAMSGSGSTMFGLFEKSAIPNFQFPSPWFVKHFLL